MTGIGRVWLAELGLPPTPRAIVEDYLALLDGLAEPIARVEHQIATLARPTPRVQALMALPGIGRLTAMTPVAEIGDIGRLPTARKLAPGRIDPSGTQPPTVRSATATHQASSPRALDPAAGRPDRQEAPPFADPNAQLARRRGNSIATVAIARRLLARGFHILNQLQAALPEKASPGVLVTTACACSTAARPD